eukprot:NODE_20298_length_804_cov_4.146233.p1 GENE.NODE_20298_length_804_cov_4.146233~~NODE_20298_length_804_cov_4.146233.p1  ORF type:complete len:200 (-),score=49.58 NODE_20298_length_804_cov_4.146233:205-753(-)
MERVRVRSFKSLAELHDAVDEVARRVRHGGSLPALVVIDSIAAVARADGEAGEGAIPRRQLALNAIAAMLKVVAGARTIANHNLGDEVAAVPPGVLVTNQVAGNPMAGMSRVTLGHVWHHAVNWRLLLSSLPPDDDRSCGGGGKAVAGAGDASRFFLRVDKSPCSAPFSVEFEIGCGGLREM